MVSSKPLARRGAAALLALLATLPGLAAGNPELPKKGEVEITPTRLPDGSTRLVVRAVLDVPPSKVWRIVSDCANYQSHLPHVAASELVKKAGNVYTCKVTIAMPFPLSNLTGVTEAVHEESDQVHKRSWKLVSGDYKFNDGSWEVRPADKAGAASLVVYTVHAEPNTAVPAWIRESAQKKALPEMINRVGAEAAKLPDRAAVTAPEAHRAIHAVFRIESARLIAGLARMVRDVGRAEELAQDALVAALERWPQDGVPDNPGAWLMATAKRRAIDELRRGKRIERKHQQLGHGIEAQRALAEPDPEAALDEDVGDDLLRLVFTACHPVLSTEARVALTLRLLGGLTTEEIARAFLVAEPTVAQRIVRAKRTLAEARVPFEVPRGDELTARLESVLQVIYLVFNEGYSATAGDDWVRPELCEDALRLGRILAALAPREPEVHGLVALMEIQASRLRARVGPAGEPVLLLDQNRARWDHLLIRRGLGALERAEALGGARGVYALQAAIAACHARARVREETDWARIAALYQVLAQLAPSPVVELNRAVALAMALGPAAGLAVVDALTSEPSLAGYHLLPSVRGDLLARLGRAAEARAEFERAASLTRNAREREMLLARAAACARAAPR